MPARSLPTVSIPKPSDGDWHYNAYLPDGYEHSNLRYPVLFMLHGYSENENAWITKGHINEAADHLIATGDIAPVLIIMPGSGDNWYLDLKEKIETAFIQDLVPEVERTFRIIPEREGRGSAVIRWELWGPPIYSEVPPEFLCGAPDESGDLCA